MKGVKMNKESSIEWLISQFDEIPENIKRTAKKLNENEIKSAYNKGSLNILENQIHGVELISAEQYFNETFNQIKNDDEQSN